MSAALILLFALTAAAFGQDLQCSCTKLQGDEYLCKCKSSPGATSFAPNVSGATETPTSAPDGAATAIKPDTSKGARWVNGVYYPAENNPAAAAAPGTTGATPSEGQEATGRTTATGLPIYTGPSGGQYHISPKSGRKVYERRK